ncbi:hypothetical protein protein (plasmid) [Bacillus cereus G9241]|nr:hypothetical protein protein [Bacillus cereus G9241]
MKCYFGLKTSLILVQANTREKMMNALFILG